MAPGSQMLNLARAARLTPAQIIIETGRALDRYGVFSSLLAELMMSAQFPTGNILMLLIREYLSIDPDHPPSGSDPRIELIRDQPIQYEPAHALLQSAAAILLEALQKGPDLTPERAEYLFTELDSCVDRMGSAQELVGLGLENHFRQLTPD